MGLDVRLPVGLLFAAIGVALVLYGLAADPVIYAKSLGYNVNLWWGLVLLVFGGVMLLLASGRPAGRKADSTAPKRSADTAARGEEPVAR